MAADCLLDASPGLIGSHFKSLPFYLFLFLDHLEIFFLLSQFQKCLGGCVKYRLKTEFTVEHRKHGKLKVRQKIFALFEFVVRNMSQITSLK